MNMNYDCFSDDELAKAIELMISPSDLTIREVAISMLGTLGYTSADIAEQLSSGEYFNSGAVFSGLGGANPQIIINH